MNCVLLCARLTTLSNRNYTIGAPYLGSHSVLVSARQGEYSAWAGQVRNHDGKINRGRSTGRGSFYCLSCLSVKQMYASALPASWPSLFCPFHLVDLISPRVLRATSLRVIVILLRSISQTAPNRGFSLPGPTGGTCCAGHIGHQLLLSN